MGNTVSKVLASPWLRVFSALAGVIWYGCIVWWSVMPKTASSGPPMGTTTPDWLAHACVYAVLAGFLYLAMRGMGNLWVCVLWLVFVAGLLCEILQIASPTRGFSLSDLVADVVGAMLALLVLTIVFGVLRGWTRIEY